MTAGLPGSGIGGVFYLLSALCAPVVALARGSRGEDRRGRMVLQQWLLAAGVIAGLVVTGWLLGIIIAHTPLTAWASRGAVAEARIPTVLRAASLAIAVGTLAAVTLAVWIAAFVVHGPSAFRPHPPARVAPNEPPDRLARASSDR